MQPLGDRDFFLAGRKQGTQRKSRDPTPRTSLGPFLPSTPRLPCQSGFVPLSALRRPGPGLGPEGPAPARPPAPRGRGASAEVCGRDSP